jgi:hypothetical protein
VHEAFAVPLTAYSGSISQNFFHSPRFHMSITL